MKTKFFLTTLVIGFALSASAEILTCEGRNESNGNRVIGNCRDSNFAGEDTFNGHPVSGYCFSNGNLEAYDLATEDFISGRCSKDLIQNRVSRATKLPAKNAPAPVLIDEIEAQPDLAQ